KPGELLRSTVEVPGFRLPHRNLPASRSRDDRFLPRDWKNRHPKKQARLRAPLKIRGAQLLLSPCFLHFAPRGWMDFFSTLLGFAEIFDPSSHHQRKSLHDWKNFPEDIEQREAAALQSAFLRCRQGLPTTTSDVQNSIVTCHKHIHGIRILAVHAMS